MEKLKLKYKQKRGWRGVYEVFNEKEDGKSIKTKFFIIKERDWHATEVKYLYIAVLNMKRIGISQKSVNSAMTEIKKYVKENPNRKFV